MINSATKRRIAVAGLIAAASLLPFSSLVAHAQPRPNHDFTLQQVLSAPFPSSLTAAPQGGRVAWVDDAQGVRNVWVADPGPDGRYRSRPIPPTPATTATIWGSSAGTAPGARCSTPAAAAWKAAAP